MADQITSIVIMGATGDLTRRKLMPALYNLGLKGRLPEGTRIVAFARSEYSDEQFRQLIGEGVREFAEFPVSGETWEQFAGSIFYVRGDVGSAEDLAQLDQRLTKLEAGRPQHNRLFYLSIAPQLYEPAIKGLGASGMAREESGWRRVIIEKPFGRDLASAQALNRVVRTAFDERQVYRIDHYLGKETMQNLLVFRFANGIFEPLWNRDHVDHVQITASEEVSVEDRGGYYDQSGVVRDMVQNHLLQLLSMVAMEPPNALDAKSLRDKKVEVLKAIRRWEPEEAAFHAVRGQYRGYLQEKGVLAESSTPTYVALRLYVDNWRWNGVPFYLPTGKAMAGKPSEISIQFKPPPHMMFTLGQCPDSTPNILSLRLQPDEGVHLNFQVKVPDQDSCAQPVDMEFHYDSAFKEQRLPEAYERLLQDTLAGDPRLFIRSDHIEEAWRIVDPLLNSWEDSMAPPLHVYESGSWGPEAADALLAEDGRAWQQGHNGHRGNHA